MLPDEQPNGAPGPGDASTRIDTLVTQAIDERALPGAVVLVTQGDCVLFHRAYGHAVLYQDLQTLQESPIPATTETLYDLASLTKVVVTTTAVLQLAETGLLDLDAPARTYLPEFVRRGKGDITVRHLLTHTGGLPPTRPFFRHLRDVDSIVVAIGRATPVGPPGQQVVYSDLGFIALGTIVARVAGVPLDDYVTAHILGPARMPDTCYRPAVALRSRIAATEYDPKAGLIWGVVHDENARAMGGVSGHAGLFGTAIDLARFIATLSDDRESSSARLLHQATTREMFTLQTGPMLPARTLGWAAADPSFMGAAANAGTVGHTGFTGTSILLDRARHLSVIVLSNRVHPTRNGPSLQPLRAALADAAVAMVDAKQ